MSKLEIYHPVNLESSGQVVRPAVGVAVLPSALVHLKLTLYEDTHTIDRAGVFVRSTQVRTSKKRDYIPENLLVALIKKTKVVSVASRHDYSGEDLEALTKRLLFVLAFRPVFGLKNFWSSHVNSLYSLTDEEVLLDMVLQGGVEDYIDKRSA